MVTPPRGARGALLVLALTGLVGVSGCTSDGAPEASPGTSSTPGVATTPSDTPSTPSGPPPSTAPAVGESTLPPAEPGQAVDFGDGLTVTVESVDDVQLSAEGPGEVDGPGVAVRVELQNGTGARIDLSGLVVTTTYADGSPGDQSTSAPSDVPTGILEPGESAGGTWVFSRLSGATGSVEVSISSISSEAVVVVRS